MVLDGRSSLWKNLGGSVGHDVDVCRIEGWCTAKRVGTHECRSDQDCRVWFQIATDHDEKA